jgi:hypothetical protein
MVTEEMFGGQHRIDEAETARAGWGDTSETTQPQRHGSRVMGQVCSYAEKIRIRSLETVGVVRDDAVTRQVSNGKLYDLAESASVTYHAWHTACLCQHALLGSGVHGRLRMLDTHQRTAKVKFARPSTSINPLTYFSKQMIFGQIPALTNGPSPASFLLVNQSPA